jgi:hypothetical protein
MAGKIFNRDVEITWSGKLVVWWVTVIDADGNVDAPITTTNLTTSWNTTLWDSSADTLTVPSSSQFNSTITVWVDDTGYDVKFFGATASAYMLWDESADDLILSGAAWLSVAWTSGLAIATVSSTLWVTWLSTLTWWTTVWWAMISGGTGAITSTSWAWAVAITWQIHEVTTTWTWDALTLANWTAWQRLTVIYVAEWAGWDTAVLTPTTLAGWTNITFSALWDSAELTYSSTWGWYMHWGTAAIA